MKSRLLLSMLVVVLLGFGSKFYAGPGAFWANNSLAGVFYVVFWCLVGRLLVPRGRAWVICLVVLVVTCLLEVLQLSDAAALVEMRGTFVGRALLGTTFVWSDFFYYLVGWGVGVALLRGY